MSILGSIRRRSLSSDEPEEVAQGRQRVRVRRRARNAPVEVVEGFFSRKVAEVDRTVEAARLGGEYLHVSSLVDFCGRREQLALRDGIAVPKVPSSSDRILWALGRAIEKHIRDSFIRSVNFEGVYGGWVCVCGHTKVEGFYRQQECDRCGSLPTKYEEFTAVCEDRKIIGHPDMLWWNNGAFTVMEIKSINKNDFKLLHNPVGDHMVQALSYKKLLGEMGMETHDDVVYLYCRKEYEFTTPYAEFHRDGEYLGIGGYVDNLFDQVATMRHAAGLLPRLGACQTPDRGKPKTCSKCADCFLRQ